MSSVNSLVGYARVSTLDQSARLQEDALAAAGAGRVFVETASGRTADRPALTECLGYLRAGDTLAVWRLDRLGRSLKDLLDLMGHLEEAGIAFRSLTEGIDTTTAGGRLVFSVFGAVAQFERELIVERTRAGLAAARDRGQVLGRPSALDSRQREHAIELRRQGRSLTEIAALLSVSASTIARATRTSA